MRLKHRGLRRCLKMKAPKRRSREEETDERSPSVLKREAKRTKVRNNPFEVEKSRYDMRVFEAVQPFINVKTIDPKEEVGVSQDKVSDGKKLDPGIIADAWNVLFDSVWAARSCNIDPQTELSGRPIHAAYLSTFKFFTRKRSVSTSEEGEVEEPLLGDDETEDFHVNAGGKALDVDEGDDDQDMDAFKVKVVDKRLGGRLVTVLVVVCEWDEMNVDKIFQAAGSAIKDALNNMRFGRYKPIFLQVWGECSWRYGILIPYGSATVDGGDIVEAHGPAKKKENLRTLERRLQRKSKSLREEYDIDTYPNGDYVVAELCVFHRKYTMPFMTCDANQGMALFIQSLLRMVVGDRVLSWSRQEFKNVINAREQELRQERSEKRQLFAAKGILTV